MRPLSLALALLLAAAGSPPARAQWWSPDVAPSCRGDCRAWGPPRFGPPGFGPMAWAGWGWRREMRWRRFAALRRRAEAAEARQDPSPRFEGWVWPGRPTPVAVPNRAASANEAAVAAIPRPAFRPVPMVAAPAPPRLRAAVEVSPCAAPACLAGREPWPSPSRREGAAVPLPAPVLRAVAHPSGPASHPEAFRSRRAPPMPDESRHAVVPVVLRSQPAPAVAPPVAPAPAPVQAPTARPSGADVPVAPLD